MYYYFPIFNLLLSSVMMLTPHFWKAILVSIHFPPEYSNIIRSTVNKGLLKVEIFELQMSIGSQINF